ncbi:MAG: PepSY-associated TM helix domain-containing protein, partial [Pseudomonadota bacterium]
EDPARRLTVPESPVAVQPLFDAWAANYPADELTFVGMEFPTAVEPYYSGRMNWRPDEGDAQFLERRWNASTGEVLPERGDGLSTWLRDFHRDLMWPAALGGRTVGRGLVGVAGIVMLLSVVTGILTHRKILKEFFTLRVRRSVRLKWKDGHNVLGIWTLPFSIMIAFTGAWLGIIVLLLPVTGMLIFKGDTDSVVEAVAGAQTERAGISAPMLSFDEVAKRPHMDTGLLPAGVFAQHWGDQNAEYTVNYPPKTELYYYDVQRVSGVTGAALPMTGLLEPGAATRAIAALTPLHYGLYGGVALKFLYLALGLGLSAMVALGNMVWIERRAHSAEGQRSPQFYDRLSRLTVGVCMGLPVASVAIFYTDLAYAGIEDDRIFWIGCTYLGSWAAALGYAFGAANGYRATRNLMYLTGAGLLGVPLAGALAAGEAPWAVLARGHSAAPAVDLTLLLLGLLCLLVARRLPTQRAVEVRRQRRRRAPAAEPPAMAEEPARTGTYS